MCTEYRVSSFRFQFDLALFTLDPGNKILIMRALIGCYFKPVHLDRFLQ